MGYVGAHTDILNNDRLPGYTLVDASMSYDLELFNPSWKGFALSANVLNLFD